MKIPKYEKKLRKTIKKTAKQLGKRGFTAGVGSSVSMRIDSERFLITPKSVYLRKMKKKMVLTIDTMGHPIYGRYGWQPADDLSLHLSVYGARGDISGIIHAHAPYLSALALSVDSLDSDALPESLQVVGEALTIESNGLEAGEISAGLLNALTNGDVVLLPGDGVLVVGRSLEGGLAQLDKMEHAAKVYAIVKSAGML